MEIDNILNDKKIKTNIPFQTSIKFIILQYFNNENNQEKDW